MYIGNITYSLQCDCFTIRASCYLMIDLIQREYTIKSSGKYEDTKNPFKLATKLAPYR